MARKKKEVTAGEEYCDTATGDLATAAKWWLEGRVAKFTVADTVCTVNADESLAGVPFDSVALCGLTVSHAAAGRLLCSFCVPSHLSDGEGNWHAGAIAALIDDVCAATIMTVEGHIKVSVEFNISYFSLAKADEELEIEGRVVGRKGRRLTAAEVEIRKKGSGEMVALGRQWMSSPTSIHKESKL